MIVKGVKFHLVLCIYILKENDSVPKILCSSLSPPIFVDSRKSARETHVLQVKFLDFLTLYFYSGEKNNVFY